MDIEPWEKKAAVFVYVALFIFVILSVTTAMLPAPQKPSAPTVIYFLPFIGLIILSVAFGAWFIACFTDDPENDTRRRQSFRFAYVFTMTTFLVLVFPVANPWQPDVLGPISLIRGCVDPSTDKSIPDSIVCGADDLGYSFSSGVPPRPFMITPEPENQDAKTNSTNEVIPKAPPERKSVKSTSLKHKLRRDNRTSVASPSEKGPDAGGASTASGASTANGASTAGATSEASKASSASNPSSASAPADKGTVVGMLKRRNKAHPGYINVRSFPWLIVIGGAYGTTSQELPAKKDTSNSDMKSLWGGISAWLSHVGRPESAASEASSGVADRTSADGPIGKSDSTASMANPGKPRTTPPPAGEDRANTSTTAPAGNLPASDSNSTDIGPLLAFSVIQGGFVVPYYVVLIAFLGGAVSLTRKIPEYQKQSERDYISSPDLQRMSGYEARENVVFEIMQLITAPFIAMVGFYALAPSTMAGGVTLAFLAGFSSSLILLQLRGMFEGLYPHSTTKSSASGKSHVTNFGTVTGHVHNDKGNTVAGGLVQVRGHPTLSAITDAQGVYKITLVPVGNQNFDVEVGALKGSESVLVKAAVENTQDITIK